MNRKLLPGGILDHLDYPERSIVQVAEWRQYAWLRHGFSRRQGGVSQAYGSCELNLGWTKDDEPAAVAENRRRFVQISIGPTEDVADVKLITIRQVHGAVVPTVRQEDGVFDGSLETVDGKAVLEGDGLSTDVTGVLLGIQTADCVPVLVADVRQRVVAAFHAGWRGTVARIVEHGVVAMTQQYRARTDDLIAAVGPSIGVCCYEVGDEVRSEFERSFLYATGLFQGQRLDLWEANRRQLLTAGVLPDRIAVVGECTACSRDKDGSRRYFSHRAEQGFTGRMLNVIGIGEGRIV